ncbi:tudor domain-containing protein 7-like isoform X2 [Haliotis cracherodii]|uniref:tudor domain-containing protein 7-like isoform X2 n=1 Tax=Haliotis cracherodii TaxID=6455 RepID=UPI0039ED7CE6
MDQPDVGLGQGCGRGRGYILKQAIEDATSTNRVKSETNTGEMSKIQEPNQSTASDEEIKKWLKEELTGRNGGIWTRHLPEFFSKFFHASAPDDFIRKIQSWSQMFQIDSITGGEIIRLSPEVHVEQGGNTEELSKSNSGILMTDIPRLFKENFNAPAPEDLITKTRSWTNMVQIESIHGREIMTSTSRISPTRHPKKPQDEDTLVMKESTSDNKTVSKSVCIPEEGSFLDVHVKWSESPTDFCCILYKHHPELKSMMEELNACLAAKSETMLNAALVPDDVYAGNYRGTWYRVIFKGYSEDNMVMTYLADYCNAVKLNKDQLQELPNKFHSLPFGSFKARLHGVAPADGSNQWSEQARIDFSNITTERDFVCLICDRADDNAVVSVRLVDTSNDDDVVVDEVLEDLFDVVRTP